MDEADAEAEGYCPGIVWEGLGLIDHPVVVHYNSNHPGCDKIEQQVQLYRASRMPYATLRDGQVLIAHGGKTEIVS